MSANYYGTIRPMVNDLDKQLERAQEEVRKARVMADRLELAVRGAAAQASGGEWQSPDPANTAVAGHPGCPQGSAPEPAGPSAVSDSAGSQTSVRFHQSAEESVPFGELASLLKSYQALIKDQNNGLRILNVLLEKLAYPVVPPPLSPSGITSFPGMPMTPFRSEAEVLEERAKRLFAEAVRLRELASELKGGLQ